MKKLCRVALIALSMLAMAPVQATSLSDYMENKLVDVLFRGTAFSETVPATYYVALYTAACTDAAAGTEVAGGSYARAAVSRAAASWVGTHGSATGVSTGTSGTISNALAITFPAATADWGLVTHWGIIDTASGAGNLILCTTMTTSRSITNGSTASFGVGALTFQIDN